MNATQPDQSDRSAPLQGDLRMAVQLPDDTTRWRCGQCGNLTRFDVVRSSRVQEYWHLDLAGVPAVEQSEVLGEVVESVACRWCGARDAVELVARPEAGGPSSDPTDPSDQSA